jgi:ribosomal protein L37AE/L43A
MNDSDRQPQCPHCRKRFCVVTVSVGVMRCTKCKKNFPAPRPSAPRE